MSSDFTTLYNYESSPLSNRVKWVSPQELNRHIFFLNNKKTPGSDSIPNIVLKKLSKKAITFLTSICNACLSIGYFPYEWKLATIVMLHKPSKPKNLVSSYRPISLLSNISKLFEKIIHSRITKFLTKNNILPNHQFGFREEHCTTYQICRMNEIITSGFESKAYTTVAFLDFELAFDKVWHAGLLNKLHFLNFPPYIFKIIQSYLQDRSFQVKINSSLSPPKGIRAGVPQGSVLAPILFNIYVADLPQPAGCSLAMFADDTAIIVNHTNILQARNILQSACDDLSIWLQTWKIQLNPSKSICKIFTLKRKYNDPPPIILNEIEIPWNADNESVRYLGVHLDKKLTWRPHIKIKLKEAYTRLAILYPILNRKSKLKNEMVLLIYKSILRPLLTYACPAWCAVCPSGLKSIQIFQNKMLRISVDAPWFIRNSQLHRELNIEYITEHIKKLSTSCFERLRTSKNAYQLGRKRSYTRLKRRLPQEILSSLSSGNESSDDEDGSIG